MTSQTLVGLLSLQIKAACRNGDNPIYHLQVSQSKICQCDTSVWRVNRTWWLEKLFTENSCLGTVIQQKHMLWDRTEETVLSWLSGYWRHFGTHLKKILGSAGPSHMLCSVATLAPSKDTVWSLPCVGAAEFSKQGREPGQEILLCPCCQGQGLLRAQIQGGKLSSHKGPFGEGKGLGHTSDLSPTSLQSKGKQIILSKSRRWAMWLVS